MNAGLSEETCDAHDIDQGCASGGWARPQPLAASPRGGQAEVLLHVFFKPGEGPRRHLSEMVYGPAHTRSFAYRWHRCRAVLQARRQSVPGHASSEIHDDLGN